MRATNDLRPPVDASPRRHRTYAVIFGHDTRPGRIFDVLLIVVILASVVVIMLESVESVRNLSTTMGHSTGLIREQCPVW